MSTKILIGVVVTIVIVAAIYFFMGPCKNDKGPVEHLIKVELVDSTWKVIYMKDDKRTKVHAKPGDKIVWELVGTDAEFQFNEKSLFGLYNASGHSDRPLKIPVLPKVKSGTYFYSIYCKGEPAGFAEEDSPPVIIID